MACQPGRGEQGGGGEGEAWRMPEGSQLGFYLKRDDAHLLLRLLTKLAQVTKNVRRRRRWAKMAAELRSSLEALDPWGPGMGMQGVDERWREKLGLDDTEREEN